MHDSLKNYEAAIKDYTKAIALDTEDASLYVARGNVWYKFNKESPNARLDWEQARKLGSMEVDVFLLPYSK